MFQDNAAFNVIKFLLVIWLLQKIAIFLFFFSWHVQKLYLNQWKRMTEFTVWVKICKKKSTRSGIQNIHHTLSWPPFVDLNIRYAATHIVPLPITVNAAWRATSTCSWITKSVEISTWQLLELTDLFYLSVGVGGRWPVTEIYSHTHGFT